ncbi:metal-sensing transcriptional repressor [Candidatus Formimonas warabiya]|uniref:Cytosolic protein n=1 Tax=Formimonas warabiya TaxID=1761012 RepID=A0A3G1KYJ7_FORW1|nr:metal-sensing transcriptional repressor [Candidatus Formimonas warabiya]ATW27556.1 cytosolic protein [Candidatus Formimonas warabiya]
MMSAHKKTKEVIDRLSRIEGHVHGIKNMVETGKECEDVLIQIAAVQAALRKAANIIFTDHLEHCIYDALKEDKEEVLEKLKKALETIY